MFDNSYFGFSLQPAGKTASCVYVCLFMCLGPGFWWKPRAEAYIRALVLIKGQQALFLSVWEHHWFLLPLWQQDKVPFQLEKYLNAYLPTAILGFYCLWLLIRNSCYFHTAFLSSCSEYEHAKMHCVWAVLCLRGFRWLSIFFSSLFELFTLTGSAPLCFGMNFGLRLLMF